MIINVLSQGQIESSARSTVEMSAEHHVCSAADAYLAIERIRKDTAVSEIHSELRRGINRFQRLCNSGRILFMRLHISGLVDDPFENPYSDNLELDTNVFSSNAPEDSVRALNIKELKSWEWHISE